MSNQVLGLELRPDEMVLNGWVHSLGVYHPRWNAKQHANSPWSRAVVMAKRKQENILNWFAALIAAHLKHLLKPEAEYIMTPVPGEWEQDRHLLPDGYQGATEMLADCILTGLAWQGRLRVERLLLQIKAKAKRQHHCLNAAERAANVRGIYALREDVRVLGKNVILLDDVITSGATMTECARVLRQAGVAEILGIALARTMRLKPPDLNGWWLFVEPGT